MSDLKRPRRTLASISDLFISIAPRHVRAPADYFVLEPRSRAQAAPGQTLRARLWVYEPESPALALGVSFAQWLLTFVPRATLLAPPPAPGTWAPLAERFGVSPWLEDFSAEPIQPHRAHENLTIIFAEEAARPGAIGGPTPVSPPRASGPEPVAPAASPVWSRAIIELATGPAALNCGAEGADMLVLVLPARVEAFVRAYRTLRERLHGAAPPVLGLVVDDPRPGSHLGPVGEAWLAVAEMLGSRGQLLGGINSRRLMNPALPLAQRLRLCEEQLSLRLRDWPAAVSAGLQPSAVEAWAAHWERVAAENAAAPEAVMPSGAARIEEVGIHG